MVNNVKSNEQFFSSETPMWDKAAKKWNESSSTLLRFFGAFELSFLSAGNTLYLSSTTFCRLTSLLYNAEFNPLLKSALKTLFCFIETIYIPFGFSLCPSRVIQWHNAWFRKEIQPINDAENYEQKNEGNALNSSLKQENSKNTSDDKIIENKLVIEIKPLKENVIQLHQERVSNWLAKHQEDYIAHAIWQDNVESVIKDGFVRSGEELLRRGAVSFETGMYGERGTIKRINLSDEHVSMLDEVICDGDSTELKDLEKKVCEDPFTDEERLQWEKIKKDVDQESEIYKKLEVKAERESTIKQIGLGKRGIDSSCIQCHRKRLDTLREIGNKYSEYYNQGQVQISYDEIKVKHGGSGLHHYLADMFEENLIESNNYTKTYIKVYEIWRQTSHIDKLNIDIRVLRNKIDWSYGDAVLLRGDPKKIIGAKTGILSIKNNHSPQEFSDLLEQDKNGEYLLLAPWQNKGKFLSLPLAEKDTLFIGPRKDLEPYVKHLDSVGVAYAYLECLSGDQQKIFQVPQKFIAGL